jgi:hypothetical protein
VKEVAEVDSVVPVEDHTETMTITHEAETITTRTMITIDPLIEEGIEEEVIGGVTIIVTIIMMVGIGKMAMDLAVQFDVVGDSIKIKIQELAQALVEEALIATYMAHLAG